MASRKIVVGLLTEEQEFQLMQAEDARATGARLGLEVEVVFAENNAILHPSEDELAARAGARP